MLVRLKPKSSGKAIFVNPRSITLVEDGSAPGECFVHTDVANPPRLFVVPMWAEDLVKFIEAEQLRVSMAHNTPPKKKS